MSEHIRLSRTNGVLLIRIDRPEKKNAIDRAMYRAMTEAFEEARSDEAVGAIVIAGVPGAFSAGNDLKDFIDFGTGGAEMGEVEAFLMALVHAPKPLVAAVDGLAIGIGSTLLLHCDMAVATPSSVFRTPFVDLGLVPEAGSSLLGPRIMGAREAFALLAMGETFDAGRALRSGLVGTLAEDAETEAMKAAVALSCKPREALALSRRLLKGDPAEIEERVRLEAGHFSERLRSREAQAAFASFMARG